MAGNGTEYLVKMPLMELYLVSDGPENRSVWSSRRGKATKMSFEVATMEAKKFCAAVVACHELLD
jgi:hypothetical protein